MSAEDERLDQLLELADDGLAHKFEAARLYAAQAEDEGAVSSRAAVLVLRMLGSVREECDHIEVRMTESLMDAGLSWEDVARETGRTSKQAAQQRYRRLGGTRTWPTRRQAPMTCEFCDERKPDVTVRRDPFAWEVNDQDWQVPMCADCEQARADDA